MATQPLLTVTQVAEEFQVTTQTIRNWIDGGALPAAKIGRAFRARADSASLATRRDLWAPDRLGLPHRRGEAERPASVWEIDQSAMPLSKRG